VRWRGDGCSGSSVADGGGIGIGIGIGFLPAGVLSNGSR
jgi:hypothetical protein